MIRRPPRSTPLYLSAASDVYKRQLQLQADLRISLPSLLLVSTLYCLILSTKRLKSSSLLIFSSFMLGIFTTLVDCKAKHSRQKALIKTQIQLSDKNKLLLKRKYKQKNSH